MVSSLYRWHTDAPDSPSMTMDALAHLNDSLEDRYDCATLVANGAMAPPTPLREASVDKRNKLIGLDVAVAKLRVVLL